MNDRKNPQTPLARLVLFIFFLAIAGTFVAGIHYFAIDLPAQKEVSPPANRAGDPECVSCLAACELKIFGAFEGCVRDCYRCECSIYECADR
jgi:hypothetical protein